ncbi:MAG: hypothetical protein O3B01_15105 [Planctomycetota bacterium]|nr:hypothetical protein [Planctomycetota bacterium]
MTSSRSYRDAMPTKQGQNVLKEDECGQRQPVLVASFLALF